MKVSAVIIVISVTISITLAVFMYLKRNEEEKIVKKATFMDIKVRVTHDVLGEYQSEAEKLQKSLDEGTKELEALNLALNTGQTEAKEKNAELQACQNDLKKIKDETVATEKDMKSDKLVKEKASWSKEIADLEKQLEQKSKVCDFVKKDSAEGMKLCGNPIPEPAKQEAPKAEAPKAEAPKAEAPKAEAPKAEAPKAEAPKAEPQKQRPQKQWPQSQNRNNHPIKKQKAQANRDGHRQTEKTKRSKQGDENLQQDICFPFSPLHSFSP
ncbi:hypothetical protein ANANG_G00008250 [Anguilla anguilla]|uniref:Uncharacterized protein n=1 Tax=Anguilla anguilla TaxID=7936 RepID=A0A9D3S9G6_ANGAN|nr:hypothetical protein ANANG_G00008250 [Anguilla anguilla]